MGGQWGRNPTCLDIYYRGDEFFYITLDVWVMGAQRNMSTREEGKLFKYDYAVGTFFYSDIAANQPLMINSISPIVSASSGIKLFQFIRIFSNKDF